VVNRACLWQARFFFEMHVRRLKRHGCAAEKNQLQKKALTAETLRAQRKAEAAARAG